MKLVEILKEDLFSDARKARAAKSQAAKPVWLHRLNKDGAESGMWSAKNVFNDEASAKAHHDMMVKNNPGKHIGHMMYSSDGENTLRVQLINGKFVKAPGGASGKEQT